MIYYVHREEMMEMGKNIELNNELKTTIFELDDYSLSDRNGFYGGKAGSKEGIMIGNDYWLVKYPKSTKEYNRVEISYTTSPLSEYIGSHIYGILGYDVHETILGIKNKKLVVACKDFCVNRGDLFEIRTLKNIYNEKLQRILKNGIENNAMNVLTAYGNGEHHYNLIELLKIKNVPELENAVLKVVPIIKENMEKIKTFIENIPVEYNGIPVCSDVKKEFYCKSMEIRLEKIFMPAYENILNEIGEV